MKTLTPFLLGIATLALFSSCTAYVHDDHLEPTTTTTTTEAYVPGGVYTPSTTVKKTTTTTYP